MVYYTALGASLFGGVTLLYCIIYKVDFKERHKSSFTNYPPDAIMLTGFMTLLGGCIGFGYGFSKFINGEHILQKRLEWK